MNKFLLSLILSFMFIFAIAKNKEISAEKEKKELKEINSKISEHSNELEKLEIKIENQKENIQNSSQNISNQLSATSLNISVFGILFGIAAVALGIYVTYIERRVVAIREENKSLLKDATDIKEEVVEINRQIQKDIFSLFLKIKRQETIHILNRLSKIPEDIANLVQDLLSTELEKEDYLLLKDAYLKLKGKVDIELAEDGEKNEGYEDFLAPLTSQSMAFNSYKLLFFQHFLDLSVKDPILNKDVMEYYTESVRSAFENDIIKSTTDFMTGIIELGFKAKKTEINAFIKAISKSEFKNFDVIYNIIIDKLRTRDNQYDFFFLLNEDLETRIGKTRIGELLNEKYLTTDFSDREKEAFQITCSLSELIQKEELEKKQLIEKQKAATAERKRKLEELKKKNEEKK